MALDNIKSQLSIICGSAAILIFLLLLVVSVSLYPGHYTPIGNWLSDLGNPNYNPQGYIFFNLGCIVTGLLLIPFFMGLSPWKSRGFASEESISNKSTEPKVSREYTEPVSTYHDKYKYLLKAAQAVGIASSFFLVMIGFFPENIKSWHWIWSALFFLSLLVTLIILNVFLWKHPRFPSQVVYYGLLVVLMDIFFIAIYPFRTGMPLPLFEWMTVLLSLGWLGAMLFGISRCDLR